MKAVSKLMTPRVVACLALASGLFGVSSLVTAGGTAQADPAWTTGFVGVGADVTQDLWAAYSGASPAPGLSQANTTFYTPLNAGSAQNFLTVSSYDANPPGQPTTTAGCIITKAGGNAWDRPNSSTEGLNALEDSVTGTLWEGSPTCTGAGENITGQVAFARSARGVKTAGSNLTFIPYGRDAVGLLVYTPTSGSPLAHLTEAELAALYTSASGSEVINGVTTYACLSISGSTPRSNLESALGVSDTQAAAAAAAADAANVSGGLCPSIVQNSGNAFYSAVSSLGNSFGAVIPISSASWESQANDVALDRSATARTNGVDLAALTNAGSVDLGQPYNSGTIGSGPHAGSSGEVPNPTYYADTSFGYNVYTVVPTRNVTAGINFSAPLNALFVGSSSAQCLTAAQNVAHDFGFASLSGSEGTCGSTTTTGNG
jgi:hypothetical protein